VGCFGIFFFSSKIRIFFLKKIPCFVPSTVLVASLSLSGDFYFEFNGSTCDHFVQKNIYIFLYIESEKYLLFTQFTSPAYIKECATFFIIHLAKVFENSLLEMEIEFVKRRIDIIAAHFAPNDEISPTHLLPMVI
jgi:hypothetical protein